MKTLLWWSVKQQEKTFSCPLLWQLVVFALRLIHGTSQLEEKENLWIEGSIGTMIATIVPQSAFLPKINVLMFFAAFILRLLDPFDSTMHGTTINSYSTKHCYGGSDFN